MGDTWARLEERYRELDDVWSAIKLLHWDQLVMMPPKGAGARARVLATMEAEAHRRLTDPEIGELLGTLSDDDSLDEERAASVRVLNHDYERAVRVPQELVRELAEVRALAYQAWTEARPASDFSILEPHLARMLTLRKEEADAVGWPNERYDALLDEFEPEMTAGEVEAMFADLLAGLRPLADAILDAAEEPPHSLTGSYDAAKQDSFCQWLVAKLGFDVSAGRVDTSPHPFTIGIGHGDVRQTTRYEAASVLPSVYAAIHETGHALYEQGVPEGLRGLPAGRVPSLGLHESQSRLWENHVGRSQAFIEFMLPHLKELFSDQIGTILPEDFYRATNHPKRSLIRVEADEVTYNLHVIVRFELELALFRDELEVSDLPDAWNDKMESHLGLRPDTDADGVLQDMHWPTGAQGYFPTYTLGTLYAAGFFAQATAELGNLDEELRSGETGRLLKWLRERIHQRAYLVPGKELGESVLGGPLTATPFLDHLKTKYGSLYNLSL
jgi:carboxypeptidase Taq